MTISETWLNKSVNTGSVSITGYTVFRQDRNLENVKKKRGGGLLTYVRSDLIADSEPLLSIGRTDKDVEAQWTMIHRPHCKNIIVGNVYRPPTGNLKSFLDYLDTCLKGFDMGKSEIYIMGDMNVDYKNQSSNEFKMISFFIKSNGLIQAIDSTTRQNLSLI